MRKRFKTKKKIKIKKYIILIFIIILLFLFIKIGDFHILTIKDNKFLDIILKSSNKNDELDIFNTITKYIQKNLFNSPTSLLKRELKFTNNNVTNTKSSTFLYGSNDNIPDIYIYNSHQKESYSYKYLEDYNIVPDVLMASSMLKDKLLKYNINALVEENDISKYMSDNNLNHTGSYIASRTFLINTLTTYPNLKLIIDLHRDAAIKSITTVDIDGKKCAKVLFVVGLEYGTYESNLKTANDINNLILNKYPTLTRGIMKKEGIGVNGVYNQDLGPNIILLELGGNENNIEEVNNTLDLIANILGEYINEKKE